MKAMIPGTQTSVVNPTNFLTNALRRNKREARVRLPEEGSQVGFTCALCGTKNAIRQPSEPESEICADCVTKAGFAA